MKNEINQQSEVVNIQESYSFTESVTADDVTAYNESEIIKEDDNDIAELKTLKKAERKTSLSFLSTSMLSVLAAVVVGITNLLNVGMSASMEVTDYDFNNGHIAYSVTVTDMTEKEELYMYLYNDGNLIEKRTLTDDDSDGLIDGYFQLDNSEIDSCLLNEDNYKTEYELKLKGMVGLEVEREFDSYVTVIEKHTAVISGVDMHCECSVDGCYHFKINYDDPNSSLYDFEAYIEDYSGRKSYCDFTDNYHDEQKIFVADYPESACMLYISYMEKGKVDRQYIMFDNGSSENAGKDNYKKINL